MPIPTIHFVISTASFSILSVGGDVQSLLGFTPQHFLDGHISLQHCIHKDDQDLYHHFFHNTHNTIPSGSFTIRLRQANGIIRIVRIDYTRNTEQLFLFVQDVKDLFENNENMPVTVNLKAMMENTDDFIFFKNANHVLTAASQTLAKICPPFEHWTELIGKTDYDIFPEKYADLYYQMEKEVYFGAKVSNKIHGYLTLEGNKGWVDNRKYPIHNDNGEIIGLFGIARDVTDRIHFENKLKHQVETDFLTGLSSRCYFMEMVQQELNCSARDGTSSAALMMDIDFFKHINDTYGHQAGDAVLKKLAEVCRNFFRPNEWIGRLGGEEFAVLLPNTSPQQALSMAEYLREVIANTEVWMEDVATPIRFTVSIGVSLLLPRNNSVDKLLHLADVALYEAKHSGRNRVCVYS